MGYAKQRSGSFKADQKRRQLRGELRSQNLWRAPLRKAGRAIDSAMGRIESAGRVIDATLRFGADRPMERVRQLCQLSWGIDEAQRQLQRAQRRWEESFVRIALSPEQADAFAPLFLEAALRFLETGLRLDELAHRATQASAQVLEETRTWAASPETGQGAAEPAPATRKTSPRYSRFILVINRRLPAAFATAADAARKVCRGRAPPLS